MGFHGKNRGAHCPFRLLQFENRLKYRSFSEKNTPAHHEFRDLFNTPRANRI